MHRHKAGKLNFAYELLSMASPGWIYTRNFPQIFSSKKILSTNQNVELTTGTH